MITQRKQHEIEREFLAKNRHKMSLKKDELLRVVDSITEEMERVDIQINEKNKQILECE